MHERNILVDEGSKKIQFVDLDSCKIEDNEASVSLYIQFFRTFSYVKNYLSDKYPLEPNHPERFTNNQNTDLYCYMIMILNNLFNVRITTLDLKSFYKEMNNLKMQGLPEPLYQIFIGIYNNIPNKNPYRLLDYIPEIFERKRVAS